MTATRPAWKAACAGSSRTTRSPPRAQRQSWHGQRHELPNSFGPAQSTLETTAETVANAGARAAGVKSAKPVYTVPTNSTLMGSVAMTALIGRVPIRRYGQRSVPVQGARSGRTTSPPTAIDIPDVAGAVFSGTASGDWTLSCVRGPGAQHHLRLQRRHDPHDSRRPRGQPAEATSSARRPGLDQRPARHPLRQRRSGAATPSSTSARRL